MRDIIFPACESSQRGPFRRCCFGKKKRAQNNSNSLSCKAMANMTDYGLALNSMMELAAHHRDVELVSGKNFSFFEITLDRNPS